MNKTDLLGKAGILLSYSLLFFLAVYFGKAVSYLQVVFFAIGMLLGLALLDIDENYLYKHYSAESKKLATRSLLFLISLLPLGLFLLTSTGSATGVGMFLGIISGLSLEFYRMKNDLDGFQKRFLYQLKRNITFEEHRTFTIVFICLSILYGFFIIFLGR